MPEKIVYVICCNDSIEFVHPGPESLAKDKLVTLSKIHYDSHKENSFGDPWTYEKYMNVLYWHIHKVPMGV